MSRTPNPREQALLDQIRAMVDDHVRQVMEHWQGGCEYDPYGPCLGPEVADTIDAVLSAKPGRVAALYAEALSRLAGAPDVRLVGRDLNSVPAEQVWPVNDRHPDDPDRGLR